MSDIFKDSINKGVPSYANIQLRCEDLINIVQDTDKLGELLQANFVEVMNKIRRPEDIDLGFQHFKTLETFISSDGVSREICFSPTMMIFSSLHLLLNANNTCNVKRERTDDTRIINRKDIYDEIYYPIIERLEKLNVTSNIHTIKREFPAFYQAYLEFHKIYNPFKPIANKYFSTKDPREAFALRKGLIDACGMQLPESFDSIMEKTKYCDLVAYKNKTIENVAHLLEDYDKAEDIIIAHPLDFSSLTEEDKTKIELYIAERFYHMAVLVEPEYRQTYLYYISNFLHEHKELKNSDLSIRIGVYTQEFNFIEFDNPDGEEITYDILYEKYRKLLIDNPSLCDINFSNIDFGNMTMDEINEFMDEYLKDLSVSWELLPDEKYLSKNSKEQDMYEKHRDINKDLENEYELFMSKRMFYDSSNPMFRIKGKNTFSGYIGFIYANGKVILDRFYQSAKKGSIAKGAAAYIMNLEDFYEMSKLTKSIIIRNNLCRRIVHKGNWQDLLMEEITAICDVEEVALQAEQLIRKLKDKKESE